jgi:hypothetical protein
MLEEQELLVSVTVEDSMPSFLLETNGLGVSDAP